MPAQYKQNLTNHVALVLDGSLSMAHLRSTVVQVADGLVEHLAGLSTRMQQETRISVYVLGSDVRCLVWDLDVLRLPSIRDLYSIDGNTALCAATVQSIRDLATVPTKYGDHAFLGFVLTDGEENWSTHEERRVMPQLLGALDANWTYAALVPDTRGVLSARSFGFPAGNIDKWDTSTKRGLQEAGERITAATENWMTGRASGVRGSRNVFDTSAARVNATTVEAALTPLDPTMFRLLPVKDDVQMRDLVQRAGLTYVNGNCYYELHKSEKVQAHKDIVVVEKATDIAYGGDDARDLLGLPQDIDVVVPTPRSNDQYAVFVQSTAPNRKPRAGKRALVKIALV